MVITILATLALGFALSLAIFSFVRSRPPAVLLSPETDEEDAIGDDGSLEKWTFVSAHFDHTYQRMPFVPVHVVYRCEYLYKPAGKHELTECTFFVDGVEVRDVQGHAVPTFLWGVVYKDWKAWAFRARRQKATDNAKKEDAK